MNNDENIIYVIKIIHRSKEVYTGYYCDNSEDAVLHDDKNFLAWRNLKDLTEYLDAQKLPYVIDEIPVYDFDKSPENPVDYNSVLNKWNLLNTLAGIYGMYFEGDCKKYDGVYELLFCCATSDEKLPPKYKMTEKYFRLLDKVFRKQARYLNRIKIVTDNRSINR